MIRPDFAAQQGALLVAGAGGALTERLDEVANTLAPVDRTRVMEMPKGLKIWPFWWMAGEDDRRRI